MNKIININVILHWDKDVNVLWNSKTVHSIK